MIGIDPAQQRQNGSSDILDIAVKDDCEHIWASSSSDDLKLMAELARRALKASVATILSDRGALIARSVADHPVSDQDAVSASLQPSLDTVDADSDVGSITASLRLPSGRVVGNTRVVAQPPRAWDADDRQLLQDLAADFVRQISLRHELARKKETEGAYADTRAQLLAVADRIPGLVFERRKLDAGRSSYTFFGASKTTLPAVRQMMQSGVAGLNFVYRDDREAVRAAILRSNLEETDLDLTFRVKDVGNTIRWIRSQSMIRREADGSVCWDGLCFDITDLVAAREEAEATRKSKEALLLNVSRDLRDPLQAIVGLAQLMKVDDDRDRVLWQAREIQIATESMIESVDRLLEQAGEVSSASGYNRRLRDADEKGVSAARSAAMSGHAETIDRAPARVGLRILLADDLDLNRKLIADMLAFEGHSVDCVADGAEAVNAARQGGYDLILMDMIMPGMDGVAATRAIRALPAPAGRVPIVALTANAAQDQLDSCLDAGMNAALTKPMSMDALAAVVEAWTRGREAA